MQIIVAEVVHLAVNGKRDLHKERFWRKALQRFAAIGKTRAQFCADENLAVHNFDYWSRKIIERDEKQQPPAAQQQEPVTFLPLIVSEQLAQPVAGRREPQAEIVFPGGSVLLFSGIGTAMLRDLFRAIKESLN